MMAMLSGRWVGEVELCLSVRCCECDGVSHKLSSFWFVLVVVGTLGETVIATVTTAVIGIMIDMVSEMVPLK